MDIFETAEHVLHISSEIDKSPQCNLHRATEMSKYSSKLAKVIIHLSKLYDIGFSTDFYELLLEAEFEIGDSNV